MMNIKDIKVGETYNVRMRVTAKGNGGFSAKTLSPSGKEMGIELFNDSEAVAFSPVTDEPKYDPCRKFQKGDKVRIVQYKGRDFNAFAKDERGETLVVQSDEEEHCNICVCNSGGDEFNIDPAYLEIVTPVEELVPYHIETCAESVYVMDEKLEILACFDKDVHPNAREAAEAECKRLNEQYRKKENHGRND